MLHAGLAIYPVAYGIHYVCKCTAGDAEYFAFVLNLFPVFRERRCCVVDDGGRAHIDLDGENTVGCG